MTRTTVVALLSLVPALALGQEGAIRPPPAGGAAQDAPAAAPDGEAPGLAVDTPAPLTEAAPAPDTYTIKSGDTLWDLSGRFLNNPWYWPKIWSYNPDIANPHWIYPGNVLKFYPAADEAPTRVEPLKPGTPIASGAGEETPAAVEEEDEGPAKELEDLSRADMKAPASLDEADAVAVAGPYKIGFVPPRTRFARHDTFVTPRELAESGTISAAFEEKLMLSKLDRAYAKFDKPAEVKVGETYVIYKTARPIKHPTTHELFGYQSVVLGSAKVVAVDDRAATIQIVQSFDPIERGALLGPWTQKIFRPVERRPNKQALQGNIVASQVSNVTQIGENHVVFVDRGAREGVQEGNVFTVLRSGDQFREDAYGATWDERLPIEAIGELLVVDVKEHASTALVTKSLKELVIGDRVEMRPDVGSGGN